MTLETIKKQAQARIAQLPAPSFKHGLRIRMQPPHAIAFKQDSIPITISETHDTNAGVEAFFGSLWERQDDTQLHAEMIATLEEKNLRHIIIPKQQKKAITIDIGQGDAVSCICITAEEGCMATITLIQTGDVTTCGTLVRLHAHKDATITMVGLQKRGTGIVLQDRRALVEQGASVYWFDVQVGGDFAIAEIKNRLIEHDAQGEINAVYFTSAGQQLDLNTISHHDGKHTHSNIVTRGAIAGNGKALSRSNIEIGREAPDSDGYEKQEAILLHPSAEADAIPNLEIDNHEVKCSHGSTVGKLDELSVFYLMSRGISKHDAYQLMLEGFFEAILGEHAAQYLPEIQEVIRRGLHHA